MFDTLRKFFRFCSSENRRKFYNSVALAVIAALFNALKIPAIAVLLQAVLNGSLSSKEIWISLGIMLISVLGSGAIKYHATMLQTEAGYGTAADKRMEIAEHMRYMPMGYIKRHSLRKGALRPSGPPLPLSTWRSLRCPLPPWEF